MTPSSRALNNTDRIPQRGGGALTALQMGPALGWLNAPPWGCAACSFKGHWFSVEEVVEEHQYCLVREALLANRGPRQRAEGKKKKKSSACRGEGSGQWGRAAASPNGTGLRTPNRTPCTGNPPSRCLYQTPAAVGGRDEHP
jgi:hypothetical protein